MCKRNTHDDLFVMVLHSVKGTLKGEKEQFGIQRALGELFGNKGITNMSYLLLMNFLMSFSILRGLFFIYITKAVLIEFCGHCLAE